MELCEKSLFTLMQDHEIIDEKLIIKILTHCCKALKKFHRDNIVHLDIKPENILISFQGNIKICDLGLVKALYDRRDARTLKEGDARFMAKELL